MSGNRGHRRDGRGRGRPSRGRRPQGFSRPALDPLWRMMRLDGGEKRQFLNQLSTLAVLVSAVTGGYLGLALGGILGGLLGAPLGFALGGWLVSHDRMFRR